jgi:hypothetical protein
MRWSGSAAGSRSFPEKPETVAVGTARRSLIECPNCGAQMRVIALIEDPAADARIVRRGREGKFLSLIFSSSCLNIGLDMALSPAAMTAADKGNEHDRNGFRRRRTHGIDRAGRRHRLVRQHRAGGHHDAARGMRYGETVPAGASDPERKIRDKVPAAPAGFGKHR